MALQAWLGQLCASLGAPAFLFRPSCVRVVLLESVVLLRSAREDAEAPRAGARGRPAA
eukprot:COSAG02_NODE_963_length_15604_cov_10.737117_17_plen_57_part_01